MALERCHRLPRLGDQTPDSASNLILLLPKAHRPAPNSRKNHFYTGADTHSGFHVFLPSEWQTSLRVPQAAGANLRSLGASALCECKALSAASSSVLGLGNAALTTVFAAVAVWHQQRSHFGRFRNAGADLA